MKTHEYAWIPSNFNCESLIQYTIAPAATPIKERKDFKEGKERFKRKYSIKQTAIGVQDRNTITVSTLTVVNDFILE